MTNTISTVEISIEICFFCLIRYYNIAIYYRKQLLKVCFFTGFQKLVATAPEFIAEKLENKPFERNLTDASVLSKLLEAGLNPTIAASYATSYPVKNNLQHDEQFKHSDNFGLKMSMKNNVPLVVLESLYDVISSDIELSPDKNNRMKKIQEIYDVIIEACFQDVLLSYSFPFAKKEQTTSSFPVIDVDANVAEKSAYNMMNVDINIVDKIFNADIKINKAVEYMKCSYIMTELKKTIQNYIESKKYTPDSEKSLLNIASNMNDIKNAKDLTELAANVTRVSYDDVNLNAKALIEKYGFIIEKTFVNAVTKFLEINDYHKKSVTPLDLSDTQTIKKDNGTTEKNTGNEFLTKVLRNAADKDAEAAKSYEEHPLSLH